MTTLRIAIVGAGIGGLGAALALSGIADEITLIERRTSFGEAGAGIQITPNASRILIRLGLGGALARVASEPERIVIRALQSGGRIGEVALGAAAAERFGAPYWFAARSDLHTVLLDAVRTHPNVRLRVGRTLAALAERDDGVTLTCELAGGGREEARADLVVGADGLWSRTRALLGDRREPVHGGYAAFRTTLARAGIPAEFARNEGGLWLGRDRHVVHYPIGAGRALNIVAVERSARRYEGWTTADRPGGATGRRDEAEPLRDLMGRAGEWSAWSLFDRPAARMARGRIALVGDAAHPTLPFLAQGGAMAIEDAAALAAALAPGGARIEGARIGDALALYAGRRASRVARVEAEARRNGRVYHAGGLTAFARNALMRRLGPAGMLGRYAWLYGWTPGA